MTKLCDVPAESEFTMKKEEISAIVLEIKQGSKLRGLGHV